MGERSSDGKREDELSIEVAEEAETVMRKKVHECPVPKPRGIIGEVLGFKKDEPNEKLPRPRIETRPLSQPKGERS